MAHKPYSQPAQGSIQEFVENYEIYQSWARQGLETVVALFPMLNGRSGTDKFELLTYSIDRPQKYFDRVVYGAVRDLLQSIDSSLVKDAPDLLITRFSNALSLLKSYNQRYQEAALDYGEHQEALRYYLHEHVFADYLQLSENIYVELLHYLLYIYYSQAPSRYKSFPQGLVSDEPRAIINQATKHFKLPEVFDPIIRNAIAHGGITFRETSVRFFDKSGNERVLSLENARNLADRLLDACNGILAAVSEYLIIQGSFFDVSYLLNQREVARMRAAFLTPEILYFVDRFDGKQMEIHGCCRHWRWEDLQLDIIRCLIIAKQSHPDVSHFSISLKDNRGIPHFYRIGAADIPNFADGIKSIGKLHKIMQESGLSWIENKRLIADVLKRFPTIGTLFHWANEIDWTYDPKNQMPAYELRDIKNISVRHHSRFSASIISMPRSLDLNEKALPTNDYLMFLFRETIIRWVIREGTDRNYGTSRLRYFKTGVLFVYAEDRRLAALSDADSDSRPNLLFRFEAPLPIFSPLRMPGLGGGEVLRIGMFYVSINPSATSMLQEIKSTTSVSPQ